MHFLKYPAVGHFFSPLWLVRFVITSLLLLSSLGGYVVLGAADSSAPVPQDGGRVGCPRCQNDGSEISQLLRRADDLYASLRTNEALTELFKVLKRDRQNPEALSKIARVYIDLGDTVAESETDWQEKRLKQYAVAEDYARKAVQADPNLTWGHFYVAASLGKIAMLSSTSKQIDLAREIRSEVEKAIALDPRNGYAYHVYGVWHRKMAEISQMKRVLANVIMWRSIPKGSLDSSVEYLTRAISLNPKVIAHYLELGRTYIAMGQLQLARSALKHAQELPVEFSDDPLNKKEAQELLSEIRDR
ncbi:MAG: hypothetical protein HYY46_25500 [Deltaproteobacteria bacterium]|nr:hypothetical protein [Deltaproteobacteria bacterium]